MDAQKYSLLKEANAVDLAVSTEVGTPANSYVLTGNVYDTETGKITRISKTTVTIDELQKQIAGLQDQINSINALITDLQALPVPK